MFCTAVHAGIDTFGYQVPVGPAPAFVADAIQTLPRRRDAVIATIACGSEFNFVPHYWQHSNSEDITAEILGKMAWNMLGRGTHATVFIPRPCEFTIAAAHWQVCRVFDDKCLHDEAAVRQPAIDSFLTHPAWLAITNWPNPGSYAPDTSQIRARILSLLPSGCQDGANGVQNYSITASNVAPNRPANVRLTFRISQPCLAAQVDQSLLRMSRGDMQVGTDGAPCNLFGGTHGDWDATLKNLIRIAELDRRQLVLSDDARKHLNEQLIDIDGGPAAENYHFWECGNEEKSLGSPQERSDDRSGFDSMMEDLWDSGWDILSFLAILLIFIAAIIAAIIVVAGAVVAIAVAIVLVIVAAAAAALAILTIPETENHLWMINSTKYLNNQYIMANGGTGYASDQSDLREWILKEMQTLLKGDFLEYNSRPYQRYSMVAITNLADFAEDVDVRTGARIVIEYAVAKYAVTSSEGRRIAPYRRKREYLPHVDGIPRDGTALTTTDPPKNGLFDLNRGADHQHALGQLYFGVSLNLPEFDGNAYAASTSYASHAIYYATSSYRPDETVYSLVIDRDSSPPVHQQLHHHGWEIVSSGTSFTITAGGLTTGMPKNTTVDPIDQLFVADDLGAAVPTTVMLAGPPHHAATLTQPEVKRPVAARRSSLERFLRFQGKLPEAVDSAPSYDLNLCVWDGFACGVNVIVPGDLAAPCMKPGHRAGWFLVRSDDADCPAYNGGPPFWMSIYRKQLFGSDLGDFDEVYSAGFVEVVDAADMTFDDFKARVAARNPGDPMTLSDDCEGTYVSARGSPGQRIAFDCERVTEVDTIEQPDPDDWPHAGAPPGAIGHAPITSSGSGRVEITSLAGKRKVVLDFERWFDPRFDTVTLP
ncbi:MAG TPA: hypothetical protein VNS34_01810 [Rhizobiaceae bacterium]|nr:hypothetical protein [Rhizobiaceae bacterium]